MARRIRIGSLLAGAGLLSLGWLWFACERPSENGAPEGMRLVWSDEFDGTGLPDPARWSYDVGDGCPELCGWGNNELQYYTDSRLENARLENGHLVIEARREPMGNSNYTSARLVSRNKGDWTYGRMDIGCQLPAGLGVWPAVWMLPTDRSHGSWPRSGEIDIMEHVGYLPDSIYGSIHTEAFNHIAGTQVTAGVRNNSLSTQFHEYSIIWEPDSIRFLMDDIPYQSFVNRRDGVAAWPFDKPFHMILNLAVGGNWGGRRGVDETIWPRRFLVDYVRVYQPVKGSQTQ